MNTVFIYYGVTSISFEQKNVFVLLSIIEAKFEEDKFRKDESKKDKSKKSAKTQIKRNILVT